ncbi:ESPR domain-containing protein [Burkholderia multivorans]|uniref:ESPR domain-containing protein n=1 Tax=Burkholderia multivorans TaxID=87883 RepID=UPI000D00BCEE|nr:ESPR domain-containing protein [Burkholderia multivorans]MBU9163744.1 ESPR domain-containing protein [Burkholderia multivorans]MBU9262647.1 ESPR domain-containing protein [Burkholderia multivorans]PRF74361.1 hypothetical protein C6Q12_19160 [Burkholderia multivorans]
MNKSYKTVWNAAIGAWVAVSEIDRARSTRSQAVKSRTVICNVVMVGVVAVALGPPTWQPRR